MYNVQKKYFLTLMMTLLLIPTTNSCKIKINKPLLVSSLVTVGVLGTIAGCHIKRNRKPTNIDIQSFGNESGQRVISSHGFNNYWGEILPYTKENSTSGNFIFSETDHNITTFNYPDAIIDCDKKSRIKCVFDFKFNQVSLGQENNIESIECAANTLNEKTIGFGVSRGAATLINFMGTKGNSNIKAIILDSPFATIEETIKYKMSQWSSMFLGKIPGLAKLIHLLMPIVFPSYSPNGLQPINQIENIDPDIPIILLHSKTDNGVPISGSRQLYIKRKMIGCNNVYLVELERGKHAEGLHGKDGKKYQNVVHAFFKKYGYTHDPTFAEKENLENYQPSVEAVTRRLYS